MASMEPKLLPRFRHGLVANFAGSAWSMLMQLVCIPLYIKFVGIEAYGLIGFYLMFQAMMQVLDLGVSPTMNREMARYSVQAEKAAEARDLVRTLEVGYWSVGILAGAALVAAAPWVATHWIRARAIPVSSVTESVMLMGVLAIFQWPVSFYQGGLLGLRKQILLNVLRIITATTSNCGAVLILWLVSPTIQAFFLWLVAANFIQVVLLTFFLWKSLPTTTRAPKFDFGLVRSIGRFAAGMSGIVAFSLILGQADKVILSKVFSLKVYGYYTIAGMFGAGLVMIVSSVFNSIYPQFSTLVAQGDEKVLTSLYHETTQLMLLLIIPAAAVLAFFSVEVLQSWTRNAEVARNAGPIASILVLGTALNGLMFLPYTLQLAYGWTSLGLKITISLTILGVPAIWFFATHYGPIGAASVWLGLQVINLLISVPLTHRRLLRHEMPRWFLQDVGPSLVAAFFVVGVARALITNHMAPFTTLAALLAVLLAALLASASFAPQIRARLLTKLSSMWFDYA
jgi:O-antigen/teichoic acid export membrane protein